MSIFSGKCDVYDHFMMFGEDDNITQKEIDEKIANSKICIRTKDGKEHKLDIKNTYDLAPYFPYIIGLAISSNENNFMIISSESYVDSEEKSLLEMYLNIMLKNVKRCKRKKQEITEEEILKDVWNRERDYIKRMVDIVKKNGTKTTINDIVAAKIHIPSMERQRKYLYEGMVALGYPKIEAYNWCFNELIFSEDQIERVKEC